MVKQLILYSNRIEYLNKKIKCSREVKNIISIDWSQLNIIRNKLRLSMCVCVMYVCVCVRAYERAFTMQIKCKTTKILLCR